MQSKMKSQLNDTEMIQSDWVCVCVCVWVCVCVCVVSAEIQGPTWHGVTNLDLQSCSCDVTTQKNSEGCNIPQAVSDLRPGTSNISTR